MSPVALRYLLNKEKGRMWETGCNKVRVDCTYIY